MKYRTLAQSDFETVFVINPKTHRYRWGESKGGRDPKYRAKTRVLKRCGDGCFIFDINRKIVWQGYEDKNGYADIKEYTAKVVVNYYNPDKYKITPEQLKKFNDRYLESVNKVSGKQWNRAFAISSNGKTYTSSSSGFNSYHTIASDVMRNCLSQSPESQCYIYAINNELKTEG